MRLIRYQVAMSLDGYIAGPDDEYDWIVMDPDIDFGELFAQFDTMLLGRRTFELLQRNGQGEMFANMRTFVISRTLRQDDHPNVTILNASWEQPVAALREEAGKDIWLFGGGQLFRSLLEAKLVDTVEVAVVPALLGGGIPLLPPPVGRASLRLTRHRIYEKSGIALLEYAIL